MGRRRREQEHENHERWLVSYADLLTLMFAFFVVMYSISSVTEGKYRVLSDALMAAFKGAPKSLDPIQVGQIVRSPYRDEVSKFASPVPLQLTGMLDNDNSSAHAGGEDEAQDVSASPGLGEGMEGEVGAGGGADWHASEEDMGTGAASGVMMDMDTVQERVTEAMLPLIDDALIEIRRQDYWLEVEIKTSILFASGSSRIESEAVPVLAKLADILRDFPNPVHVEGFTDNVPIRSVAFPSNWELSAARAASVVHLFMKHGVRPGRMVALGYGEYRPVADNNTAEGRGKNRRVVIIIPTRQNIRRNLDIDHFAASGRRPAPVDAMIPALSLSEAPVAALSIPPAAGSH